MVRINTDVLLAAVARLLIGWWPLKRQYSEGESWDEGIQFYSRASTLKNGPGTESKPTPKKTQSISGNSKVKNLKAFYREGKKGLCTLGHKAVCWTGVCCPRCMSLF